MLMFRSFALGLLAACFVVIAMRPAVVVQVSMRPPNSAAARSAPGPIHLHARSSRLHPRAPSATVIDAASAATPSDLVALLRLRSDERIAAVDDLRSTDPSAAIAAVGSAAGAKGRYVDLTIASPFAERRVVLMIH